MGVQRKIAWDQQDGEHLNTDAYYHAQWQAYAWRRGSALFFTYMWAPVSVGLFWLSRHLLHEPILSLCFMLLWLGMASGLVYWAGEFRCPRCRRRYAALGHRKGDINLTRGIFDKICSNCKLRKFERAH